MPAITPAQMPRLSRDLLRSNRDMLAQLSRIPGALPPALAGVQVSGQALADREQFAELFLASAAMTQVAVDAARDVPAQILAEHRPCTTGVLAYSGGLPATAHPNHPEVVTQPEVLSWTQYEDQLHIALWIRPSLHRQLHEIGLHHPPSWLRLLSCELPLHEPIEWSDYRDSTANLASLLVTTWMLMMTPTVAETTTSTEAGPKGKNGKRALPREVKTVDLRRLARRPAPEEEEEAATRTFRHQWVVRGHWRQQPVGPGRESRRTTWVPSYLKGPEGAPFLPSETVFVWRR